MLMIQKRLVIWGAGILLLLLASLPVTAQITTPNPPNRTDEFEITGIVTGLTTTSFTLSGLRFQITRAEINDPISVGTLVKVHYSVDADGVRVAHEVELAQLTNPDDDNRGGNNGNTTGNSNSGDDD